MIEKILLPELIHLKASVENWRDAVRMAGNLLVAVGGAEKKYVESMVTTVEELGPYIVICPGVALAHAKPESGANKICLSLITLENPVPFGHPENDPVDLIFALAAVDHDSHIELLAELASSLEDPKCIEKIKVAQNSQKAYEILSN